MRPLLSAPSLSEEHLDKREHPVEDVIDVSAVRQWNLRGLAVTDLERVANGS